MPATSSARTRLRGYPHVVHRVRVRLAVALAVGVVAGALVPLGPASGLLTHLLTGFVVSGLAFAVPLLWRIMRADADATRAHVEGEDPGARVTDVLVIVVGLLSLAGVGVLLVGPGGSGGRGAAVVEAVLAVVTVAVGWLCVHTVYSLRYARIYYSDPHHDARPCIDFNQDEPPRWSDFVYFAFNLGMTFQVSDTSVRSSALRRVVLGHCVLSYVFGTVVIASTINLVAGLSGG